MNRRAWILLLTLAALWGASYLFIKVALEDLSPGALLFARVALGAAVLLPIAVHRRAFAPLHGHWGSLALLSFIHMTAPLLLIALGEREISSSLTGILVSAAPIFTVLIAIRVDQAERVHGWGAVGVVAGMLGIVLLFGVDLSGDTGALLGGLMILLAALGYATSSHYARRHVAHLPAVGVVATTLTLSALTSLPGALLAPPAAVPALETIAAMLVLGAGGTGFAFLIYYTLVADVGPSRAALVAYIAPVFSVFYGVTLLDEPLTVGAVAGLVLILGGSWLAAEGRLPWQARTAVPSRSVPARSSAPAPARAP